MERLRRITASPEAAFYAVEGDRGAPGVARYVVSTPQSRAICNRPELLGFEYTEALGQAMAAALRVAPFRSLIEGTPPSKVCVLNLLRGGLNFNLRAALNRAYGLNTQGSAFLSSQRAKVSGRWTVGEDGYRKLDIPRGAVILAGDVVATGVTLGNGLEVVLEHILESGSSVRGLIFFTIGCERLEEPLAAFDERCRGAFGDVYQGCSAVYLEGKFQLADEETKLRIAIPGTDLIRLGALLAPELEASQYESIAAPLERCAIYDAGSRAFDIAAYVEDVADYWQRVARLAAEGLSLAEALSERWPDDDRDDAEAFLEARRARWVGVGRAELEALRQLALSRWSDEFRAAAESPAALLSLCRDRLALLEGLL